MTNTPIPIPEPQKLQDQTQQHAVQVHDDLKKAGADAYDFLLPETHALAGLIHQDERILGIVYGHYKHMNKAQSGKGALVATTNRMLLLDKKPMFTHNEELSYTVISGVSYARAGLAGTVTLNTRMGDISIRTMNHKCAHIFVEALENRLFKTDVLPDPAS